MDDFIPNIVLSGWFVTIRNVIPMSRQWIVIPIVVIIIMVYQLIVWFLGWYIYSEVRILRFIRTILSFILGILVYVGGYSLIIIYRWEYIRLMSFLLISFWQRNEAVGSSISAVIYNRIGDFGILIFCYIMESWILGMIAVLGKSAIWIIRYWLPIAMEGPTPVSSLLHSSTIVVAGVILSIMLGRSVVMRFTSVMIISLFLPAWFDGKKIIALSTSVHLVVMFLAVSLNIYRVCLIHILTHAFVKATCFVASRVKIGMTGNQELRWWRLENQMLLIVLSFLLLCRVRRSLIYNSKEMIVFQILMFLIVLVGWKYTKTFFNGTGRLNTNMMKIQYSICLIVVMRGTRFRRVDLMLVMVMIRSLIPIFNSWSGYVVNK